MKISNLQFAPPRRYPLILMSLFLTFSLSSCFVFENDDEEEEEEAPPPTTYTVGGSVSGLTGTGLVIQNNGGDDISLDANGDFTFATALETD
ncbi:MAG: hypothetical protein DRQ47_09335, partial [Gammaproteobacteria bacterium]